MAASLLPDSTSCFFPCPLSFLFSSVPFLLTYLLCSPSQVSFADRRNYMCRTQTLWNQIQILRNLLVLSCEDEKYSGSDRVQMCIADAVYMSRWGRKPAGGSLDTCDNPSLCTSMCPAVTSHMAESSNGKSWWKMLRFAGNSSERLWAAPSRATWMQKIPQCKAPSCNLRRWPRLQRKRNTRRGASCHFGSWLTTSPQTLSGRKVQTPCRVQINSLRFTSKLEW